MFRFSEQVLQVPSYEQSMLEVSRRIRSKSAAPPSPSLTSSTSRLVPRLPRSASRASVARAVTPSLTGAASHSGALAPDKRSYASHLTYTQVYDFKRQSTPARGF